MKLVLYRALPAAGFRDGALKPHLVTRRVPSNVPCVVDNLWEWLRPQNYPSRRHAAYASPTPELALQGASVRPSQRSQYVVARVRFPGRFAMVQLTVADARFHPDVKALPRVLLELLGGASWIAAPLETKRVAAPLYAPALAREETEAVLDELPDASRVKEALRTASRFWTDAQWLTDQDGTLHHPEGELFFEAFDGYLLTQDPSDMASA